MGGGLVTQAEKSSASNSGNSDSSNACRISIEHLVWWIEDANLVYQRLVCLWLSHDDSDISMATAICINEDVSKYSET